MLAKLERNIDRDREDLKRLAVTGTWTWMSCVTVTRLSYGRSLAGPSEKI
jgi:G:T-mismatch repair DNA endonuclease (very short patch repair protein)